MIVDCLIDWLIDLLIDCKACFTKGCSSEAITVPDQDGSYREKKKIQSWSSGKLFINIS